MNFIHKNLSITRRQIFILLRGLYVLLKIFMYTSLPFLKKKLQKTLKKKLPKCSGCKYVTLSSEFAGNKLINV